MSLVDIRAWVMGGHVERQGDLLALSVYVNQRKRTESSILGI
jgi:hypothetical protein